MQLFIQKHLAAESLIQVFRVTADRLLECVYVRDVV